jgi:hypothetical protein
MLAYLQHGNLGEPMRTEEVPVKREPMAHHLQGLQYTASGYGSRIPTEHMVQHEGKWRRVYCAIFSNVGTLYIGRFNAPGMIRVSLEASA